MAAAGSRPNDWENPSLFGVNKRVAHVPLYSFKDVSSALQHFRDPVTASANRLTLSQCPWHFKLYDSPGDVPADFMQPSFSVEDWGQVGALALGKSCNQPQLMLKLHCFNRPWCWAYASSCTW